MSSNIKYLRAQLENHLNGASETTDALFEELIRAVKADERDRLLCGQYGTVTLLRERGGEYLGYLIPAHCIDPTGAWRKGGSEVTP
jgi:hypothetical protein